MILRRPLGLWQETLMLVQYTVIFDATSFTNTLRMTPEKALRAMQQGRKNSPLQWPYER